MPTKSQIADWWSRHPQDYQGYNAPETQSEDVIASYLEMADLALRRDHIDLHVGEKWFANLLPYDQLAGRRVLEVGCGLGAVTGALARSGAVVAGLDISEFGSRATAWRLRRIACGGSVTRGDAEQLPFQDGSFDYIWSWGVIHHSPSTANAVREMHRVLSPGGELCVMVYHRYGTDAVLNILLRYGVLRLQLLHHSAAELLTRYSDGKQFGGCPMAQYFTRDDIRRMFSAFRSVRILTHGYWDALLRAFPKHLGIRRLVKAVIPDFVTRQITSRFGHFLIVRAIK